MRTRPLYQRILALLGVVSLAGLSVAAFLAALMGSPADALRLLAAAVFVPIGIWLVLWATGRTPGKTDGLGEQKNA